MKKENIVLIVAVITMLAAIGSLWLAYTEHLRAVP